MTDAKMAEYERYFLAQDTDGDGQLNQAEFANMVQSMGLNLSKSEVIQLFKKTDANNSSKVSFYEFSAAFFGQKKTKPSDDRIQYVFREADRNNDGHLSREECFNALKQLGIVLDQTGLTRVIELMDKNEDGRICFNEFRYFVSL